MKSVENIGQRGRFRRRSSPLPGSFRLQWRTRKRLARTSVHVLLLRRTNESPTKRIIERSHRRSSSVARKIHIFAELGLRQHL